MTFITLPQERNIGRDKPMHERLQEYRDRHISQGTMGVYSIDSVMLTQAIEMLRECEDETN